MVSSQHLHEIEAVSDKLLLLVDGRVRFFGDVSNVGADRRVNRFELDGPFEIDTLRRIFNRPEAQSVYYTGVAFVLTTSRSVTTPDVIRRLLDEKVQISYFRDISHSAKGLLQDEADAS